MCVRPPLPSASQKESVSSLIEKPEEITLGFLPLDLSNSSAKWDVFVNHLPAKAQGSIEEGV